MCMLILVALLIVCSTRITETSATLIDNIITNASLINPLSCIVYSDVSHHLPIYLSTDLDSPKARRSCYYYKRNFGEANPRRFISNIQQTDWDPDNCDFTSFSKTFTSIFDNCFPLEKYSLRKNTTPRNRWMTNLVWLDPVPKEKKCIKLISRTHLMLILGNINHIGIS